MTTIISLKQTILLVEDSPEDAEATRRSFQKSGLRNPLVHCESGDEALGYLFGSEGPPTGVTNPSPGMVLLDLNMPGTDGREVLKQIKNDPTLTPPPSSS